MSFHRLFQSVFLLYAFCYVCSIQLISQKWDMHYLVNWSQVIVCNLYGFTLILFLMVRIDIGSDTQCCHHELYQTCSRKVVIFCHIQWLCWYNVTCCCIVDRVLIFSIAVFRMVYSRLIGDVQVILWWFWKDGKAFLVDIPRVRHVVIFFHTEADFEWTGSRTFDCELKQLFK